MLILVAIGGVVWFMRPAGETPDSAAPHGRSDRSGPTPVATATIQKGDINIIRRELGTVTPLANVVVRTQISGLLMEIAFKEGQIVQAGDFLAQIDPRPYELAKEQAEGSLQRDQALLKDAQLNLDRYKKLFAQDSISKQQMDTQQSLVDQYLGAVQTDQGQIDAAKLNLTYCHITSPVTGRVGLRQVDQGNYVQTTDANGIVIVTQLQPITVIFTLPEDDLPSVMKRTAAGAELVVTAFDRTQSNLLATGKLSSIDNQIDTTTGTVKLRAQFDNTNNELFPNQFVNADLLIDTMHDVIVAPQASIQHGTPGAFVYKVDTDNTVSVAPIKLGPADGDKVQITDGLSVGDIVVVDGTDRLRDGAKITLPDQNPKPSDVTDKPASEHHHHTQGN